MPIVNIICCICTEAYNNSDEVYSTSCGHLFHLNCLSSWLRREKSCPQCRRFNPTYHKLCLSFIESEEATPNKEDIFTKIKSSEEKVAELLAQSQEIEENFLKLHKQYSATLTSTKEFKEKLSQNINAEENFLNLQAQYTDVSEMKKQLEDRLNQLYVENESIVHELNKNEQLESGLDAESVFLPNSTLNEKLKSINYKLAITTQELQKQINSSTQLNIENMKLKSYINCLSSAKIGENVALKEINQNSTSKKSNPNRLRKNSPENINRYIHCVIIKGLDSSQITAPLENVVVKLASKMNIILYPDDLIKIDVENANMLVQFKELEMKNAFLSNKTTLQHCTDTKTISIEEFMDDESRSLFLYAKKMLHNRGLIYFYFENNKIYAKKNRTHRDIVHIHSKSQVDDIAHMYDSK